MLISRIPTVIVVSRTPFDPMPILSAMPHDGLDHGDMARRRTPAPTSTIFRTFGILAMKSRAHAPAWLGHHLAGHVGMVTIGEKTSSVIPGRWLTGTTPIPRNATRNEKVPRQNGKARTTRTEVRRLRMAPSLFNISPSSIIASQPSNKARPIPRLTRGSPRHAHSAGSFESRTTGI